MYVRESFSSLRLKVVGFRAERARRRELAVLLDPALSPFVRQELHAILVHAQSTPAGVAALPTQRAASMSGGVRTEVTASR
ncbi:hypothetical protein FRACA_200045 [Frankia canadensis]|uniref:Uncharacterized protein n=1 Tax=Frankia canadensis TaxID=1836972 RepID=A0A2I2KQ66_9ACTN|nr:hypothetical protein [Frankia canadensis]SNQ47807.1 hypothetical protein FRACA_200045 [Frankia canadensis]SOU55097.1 hypothetical protein FRACA_200045 [Frankia canadensis]